MTQPRPSAMELMQYADGELDEPRATEIQEWLDTSSQGRAVVATFGELGSVVRSHADKTACEAGADSIADEVMSRIAEEPRSARRVVQLRPQHGAATVFGYALGGLAMAATVALVMWHFAAPNVSPVAHNQSPSTSGPSALEMVVASAPIPSPDLEDQEPGVSVDAIEFGAHTGTIFYVPTDTGTTTVVWLTDDESGETK